MKRVAYPRPASPPPTLAKRNHFSTQTNQAESESAPKARPDSPRHAILKQQGSRANPQPTSAPLSCLPACLPTLLQWVKVRNGPRTKRSDLLSLFDFALPRFDCVTFAATSATPPCPGPPLHCAPCKYVISCHGGAPPCPLACHCNLPWPQQPSHSKFS